MVGFRQDRTTGTWWGPCPDCGEAKCSVGLLALSCTDCGLTLRPEDALQRLAAAPGRRQSAGASFPPPARITEILAEGEPAVDWLTPPVIPAGGNILVAGYPKSHKTHFVLDLAVSLATGTPFLGRFGIPQRRRVGVVLMEGIRFQAGRRIARLCEGHSSTVEEADDQIHIWHRPPLRFDLSTVTELGEHAHRLGLEVLIVDAWSYVASGSPDRAEEVTPQLMAFSSLRSSVPGLTTLLVHHARKAKDTGTEERLTDLIRGSSAFGAWYDCGIVLGRKDEQSPVSVRVELRDYLTPPPFTFTVEDDEPASPANGWRAGGALRLRASEKSPAELAAEQRAEDRILEVLQVVHARPGCTKTDLDSALTGKATDIRHARDLAVSRGLLADRGEGGSFRPASYHLTEAGSALVVPSSHRRPDDGEPHRRPVVPPPVGGDGGRWAAAEPQGGPGR